MLRSAVAPIKERKLSNIFANISRSVVPIITVSNKGEICMIELHSALPHIALQPRTSTHRNTRATHARVDVRSLMD